MPAGEDEPDELRGGEAEVVDAVPVLEERRAGIGALAARLSSEPVLRRATAQSPVVQAAAAAAGGFVAGAAVLGLVQRRQRRAAALARPQRRSRTLGRGGAQTGASGAGELLQIVASRSLLLDVHLLGTSSPQNPR